MNQEQTETFEVLFQQKLLPLLQDLENKRKSLVPPLRISIVFVILPFLFILFLPTPKTTTQIDTQSTISLILILVLFIAIIAILIIYFTYERKISRPFKKSIVPPLLALVNENLEYSPTGSISEAVYKKVNLHGKYSLYHGEDLISGEVSGVPFSLCEIHTQRSAGSNSDGKTKYKTIFEGFFLEAKFNKPFLTRTIVCARGTKPRELKNILSYLSSTLERIHLEDPDFENLFDVYGDNQTEARYILSPSTMERMKALQQRMGTRVEFSFLEEQLYVTLASRVNFLEPRFFKPITDDGYLKDYLYTLNLILEIIEDLKLNDQLGVNTSKPDYL